MTQGITKIAGAGTSRKPTGLSFNRSKWFNGLCHLYDRLSELLYKSEIEMESAWVYDSLGKIAVVCGKRQT
jgi:hypothetical protein